MTNFVWPSDADRAESDELNRVCEQLERVMDNSQAIIDAGKRLRELADDLMPGLKYIVLQDYALLTAFDEWDRAMRPMKQEGENNQ